MKGKTHDPLEGVTPEGMITTGAQPERLAEEFTPVLEAAIERLKPHKEEVSLYVYGSVATGSARVGHSDVDLVTVGLDRKAAQGLSVELSRKYRRLCRGVECGPAQLSSYEGSDSESYGNRVFLRHYCVHLAGPDFRDKLPDYPADAAAARGFNGNISLVRDNWRVRLEQGEDPSTLGRPIARKTLFAVTGLVSIHDRTWTTDRVTAAKRWGYVVPELSQDLETLVMWSESQDLNLSRESIEEVLDGTVDKVVNDFSQHIGLWASNDV